MTQEEMKRFTLRLETKLFEKIKIRAKRNKRAIGKEIEFRIAESIEKENK